MIGLDLLNLMFLQYSLGLIFIMYVNSQPNKKYIEIIDISQIYFQFIYDIRVFNQISSLYDNIYYKASKVGHCQPIRDPQRNHYYYYYYKASKYMELYKNILVALRIGYRQLLNKKALLILVDKLQMVKSFFRNLILFTTIMMKENSIKYHRLDLSYVQFEAMSKNLSYSSIGKYYIYQKLGEGGFGQVYKGMDDDTKLAVAVKIINLHAIKNQNNQKLKEIKLRLSKNQDKMMAMCNNLNLVKCYDVYENDDLKIIVMEFCNGGTLERYIGERKKIPQKEAILILKQILNGIAELHSHKIIHRDLKADNILLHNSLFKIADFGFSKTLQITNDEMIGTHTFLGTLSTMAPEVLAKQKYGLKADIWSIGVIFFQMIFGHLPFTSTSKPELLDQIRESRLMKKDKLVFNGTVISTEAYDFIKLILVLDQKKRIGWKQLIRHPIFYQAKNNKISRILVDNQSIQPPRNVDDDFNPQEDDLQSYNLRKETQTAKVVKIMSQQIKGKQQQLRLSEQDKAFLWMNEKLYQCLKAQLIYQEVICKIQEYKLLDLKQREVIELLYLLSTRCFLDLSPINEQMMKMHQKYPSFVEIYQAVQNLYQRLKRSWEYYVKVMTAIQDKIFNRLSDFFESSKVIDKKNKFMNGIEGIDYTKNEQIFFIQRQYIRVFKDKIKGKQQSKTRDYLFFYTQINQTDPALFKKFGFDSYIEKLITHN